MVLRTLGDLYFSSEVRAVSPSAWIYVQAGVLGIGATAVAAFGPALDASRCTPDAALQRASLERTTLRRSKIAAASAVPVLLLAGALLLGRSLWAGFGALFAVLCAGALLTPGATAGLMRILAPPAARLGLETLLAVRGVRASLSRTGVATAALAVAVATVIGIGLMIGSFRSSLVDWLHTTLSADIYVTLDDAGAAAPLSAAMLKRIEALPSVRGVGLTRFTRVPTRYGELGLRALQPGPKGWGLDVVGDTAPEALAGLQTSDSVAISETFAYRSGLGPGDAIELPTATGSRRFSICAVFRDYNTGGGAIAISLARYRRYWHDRRVSGVGVHLTRGADRAATIAALKALFAGRPADVRSTGAIERLSLQIFDRTFRITEVLRILAGVIAFFGVLSAVLAIQLERGRELAVLRALGFAPEQLARLSLTQTGLLGLAAGLVAVPLGGALAAILVYVINRRSFGWTMHLVMAPGPIAVGVALALGAALLAGVYPAVQSWRVHWQGALREE
jgi:putative ABC transport system permease protein